ncbi:MAG: PEP-CTERM sorting domain-containing protein [Myxococcota bacterium]
MWQAGHGMHGLGDLPNGIFSSAASGVSDDGDTVVGRGQAVLGSRAWSRAWRWTRAEGMVDLGDLPGGIIASAASDVSSDGTVIVGYGSSTAGFEAFRWTVETGMVGLGDLRGGGFHSAASAVSSDGLVIVGFGQTRAGREAFRWTKHRGMRTLGDLQGGEVSSEAADVSADGSVVVGRARTDRGDAAFVWDVRRGMRSLRDVLVGAHGVDLDGWVLGAATAVSDDGSIIVGTGTNAQGRTEAWRAVLPRERAARSPSAAGLVFTTDADVLPRITAATKPRRNGEGGLYGAALSIVARTLPALQVGSPGSP